jgi:hypothetical protein
MRGDADPLIDARTIAAHSPVVMYDFKNRCIVYPGQIVINEELANLVKGGEAHTHVIFRPFIPILKDLVAHRKALREEKLCELPFWKALSSDRTSLEWRWFLDELGFTDISHHGLRARWGTMAVRNQMHPTLSMQFMHHKSPYIHRKYQDLVPQDCASALDDLADKLGL